MSEVRDELQAALGGAYTIQRELGGGGMSRVFLVRDESLGRDVVLKLLMPELASTLSADRFTREIRMVASLQEPHIVPVLAAGQTADGLPWFTMPYVSGESLRARLVRGLVAPNEALGILRNVAQALAYAHARGVVHRDIKPENVLLSSGTAVVADFGIAKAVSASRTLSGESGITQAGMAVGTPAYMAPEQATGDPHTDHRADVYAWGVLAYELLGGAHPFAERKTPSAMTAAHIAEVPTPLAVDGVSASVRALVMRALEKDPARRPATMDEVLATFAADGTPGAVTPGTSRAATASVTHYPRAPFVTLVLGVLVIGGGAAIMLRGRAIGINAAAASGAHASASDSALTSVAVLPFVNTSGNAQDEYFSDGMTDELAHALSRLPGLKLAGRSSSFSFKGKSVLASEVGKTLGVGAIIEGSVRRAGDRLRVTAQLTSTRDGRVIWSDAFERSGTDVFAVQDAFTSAIAGALRPMLGQPSSAAVAAAPDVRGTTDAVAYDLYLRGRFLWASRDPANLDSAVRLFEQAVARDPTFARGWAGLALTHAIRPSFNALIPPKAEFAAAEEASRRAMALDSTLADPHAVIGFMRTRRFDFPAAEREFVLAPRLEPGNATVHSWSSLLWALRGDTANALGAIHAAIRLDPLSRVIVSNLGALLAEQRRWPEAMRAFDQVRNLPGGDATGLLPVALVFRGRADSALALVAGRSPLARGRTGQEIMALVALGRWNEARRVRTSLAAASGQSDFLWNSAIAAVVFGEHDRAAEFFVQSFEHEATFGDIVRSPCYPLFDPIRDKRVFKAFLAEHGLPGCNLRSPWPFTPPPAEAH